MFICTADPTAARHHAAFNPAPRRAFTVDRLDEAWARLGLRSRMDLFRAALRTYLANAGEMEVAELLSPVR